MSFLSVVICTLNREAALRDVLARLARQTLPRDRFEVLVVDDGSDDATPRMMEETMASGLLPALTYLRHERRGPGFTQNRGIRAARGPLVLLLCDDMQPQPDLLATHVRYHEQYPDENVALVGRVVQSPDLPDTVFLRNWDPIRHDALRETDDLGYLDFCGCHVSLKKAFMLRYGMFLERRAAAHEDIELAWRLARDGGMRLLHRRDAVSFHNHVETIDSACRRAFERGRNFDLLVERVPDPRIYVRNHLVDRTTLPQIAAALRAPSARVAAEDRGLVKYLAREAIRRIAFRRITVRRLFLPLIRRAERSPALARLVTPLLIRGVVSFHFLEGYREKRMRRAPESPERLAASRMPRSK
jgi:glycosyltransferase involved in cell wall biosynthesis